MAVDSEDEGIGALAEPSDLLPGEESFDDEMDAPVSFDDEEEDVKRPKPQVSNGAKEKKGKKGFIIGAVVSVVVIAGSVGGYLVLNGDGFSRGQAISSDASFAPKQGFIPTPEKNVAPQNFETPASMQVAAADPMQNKNMEPVNFTPDDMVEVTPPTPKESPAPVVSAQVSGISPDAMGKILQDMEESLASKIPDISGIVAELNSIGAEQRKISATMLNMNRTLGELSARQAKFMKKIQGMQLAKAKPRKSTKKTVKAKVKSKYEYVLVGAVQGKAWIKNKSGARIATVFEGDKLKHYGKITKIMSNGKIITTAGVVKVTYP